MARNWISDIFGSRSGKSSLSKRKVKSTFPRRVRPGVEALEDRTVPTTALTPLLPSPMVSNPATLGAGFGPSAMMDPSNPLNLVEVHSTGAALAGNFSTDGGQT